MDILDWGGGFGLHCESMVQSNVGFRLIKDEGKYTLPLLLMMLLRVEERG